LPFFVALLAGAPQVSGNFDFGKIAHAVKAADPGKVAEAIKDAKPGDVLKQGADKARQALDPIKDQAKQTLKDTVADVHDDLHSDTADVATTLPPVTTEAPHDQVKKAVQGTNVKSWADALRGGNIPSPEQVVKSLQKKNPLKAVSEDAKKVADALQDASAKQVVQEIQESAGNSTKHVKGKVQRPLDMIGKAGQKINDIFKGKSPSETVEVISKASPKKIAESLPDTTAGEVVKALRGNDAKDPQEGSDAVTRVTDEDPKDKGEPGSGSSTIWVALLFLVIVTFGGWRTFLYLTRPKRTGMPMLDGELHEGDSVQMMAGGGWMGGGGGGARDFQQPGFTRF